MQKKNFKNNSKWKKKYEIIEHGIDENLKKN